MNKKTTGTSIIVILLALLASYLGYKPKGMTNSFVSNAMAIDNYRDARTIFWNEVYPDGGETLYCGEKFDGGYHKDINIEHVFPMSWVAWKLSCGERKNCRENSAQFNQIEADLYNLFPAKVKINKARSSHPFGTVKGEKRKFGRCDFEIDYQSHTVEPRETVRGDIARTMFYMADHYDLDIREKQYKTLQRWNKQDPVDAAEKARNKIIKSIQGNANPFIK